jgi:uncharacterized protein YjaZ
MRIIDLTDQYNFQFINRNDRRAYENSFPELFDHYYRFWADSNRAIAIVKKDTIDLRRRQLSEFIADLEKKLNQHNLDLENVTIVYFIGIGTTNGHAFRHDGKLYVWLPLETYTSELLVRVFVTHEIVHALHYNYAPAFYFHTKAEQLHLARQLITEGLASYLTMKILDVSEREALWADFLDDSGASRWFQLYEHQEMDLLRFIYENYHTGDDSIEIFYLGNLDNIRQNRSGYYAGMKLIGNYATANNLTIKDLLLIDRQSFEQAIYAAICQRLNNQYL